jgi:hypothetical protein
MEAAPAMTGSLAATEPPLEGGCDCRRVRFRLAPPPLIVHCCHCRWCQRETGSAFALNARIEAEPAKPADADGWKGLPVDAVGLRHPAEHCRATNGPARAEVAGHVSPAWRRSRARRDAMESRAHAAACGAALSFGVAAWPRAAAAA